MEESSGRVASNSKQLLTISDLREIYSLRRSFVYELIKSGDLKARRMGRRTMFDVRDVEAWREKLPYVRLDHSEPQTAPKIVTRS